MAQTSGEEPVPAVSVADVSFPEDGVGLPAAVFTVSLSAPGEQTVTVDFATADDTAKAGADYAAAGGSLTFAPGETSKSVAVQIKGDALDEPDETFFINLTNAVNADIAKARGVGTISDDDSAPAVSVEDAWATKGNIRPTLTVDAVFTVTLSAQSGRTVSVGFETADNTAIAERDYPAASGRLTFNPGETSKTVVVSLSSAAVTRAGKSFFLNLTEPDNAVIGDGQGVGNMLEVDCFNEIDPLYRLTDVRSLIRINTPADLVAKREALIRYIWKDQGFPKTKAAEGVVLGVSSHLPGLPNLRRVDRMEVYTDFPAGSGKAPIRSVIYQFHPLAGNDRLVIFYQGHWITAGGLSTLQFGGGQQLIASFLREGYSVLTFEMPLYGENTLADYPLNSASHDVLGASGADQINPLKFFVEPVALALNYATRRQSFGHISMIGLSGGGWATTLYAALDPRVQVSFPIAGSLPYFLRAGSACGEGLGDWEQDAVANAPIDYMELYLLGAYGEGRRQLQILNKFDECCFWGVRHQTYQSTVTGVLAGLGPGEFGVYLDESLTHHGVTDSVLASAINVLNSAAPQPPVLKFSASAYTVSERDGVATVTVSRSGSALGELTIDYATADGTARQGADYTAAAGALNFAAGEASKSFTIPITGDLSDEPDETINLTLQNPVGSGRLGLPDAAVLTITDDDPVPSISVNDVAAAEGSAGTATAAFNVSLSAPSAWAVTVSYATADATAAAGTDYVAASGSLTFAPGETSKTVAVQVRGDALDEADETFLINLSDAANASVAKPQGVGTITDNDATPTVAVGDVSVTEGDSGTTEAVFIVSLSAASGQVVNVGYATGDATAVAPGDYAPASGVVTFGPGETSKSVAVQVNGDTAKEKAETFVLGLTNPLNASLVREQGRATILNDDALLTLLTEADSDQAIALESVTLMRAPFKVAEPRNFSADQRARVMLFAVNLELEPGETASAVTARAEDSQGVVYSLPVEYALKVPNSEGLTQVGVKLVDELANAGEVWLTIHVHGESSNRVLVKIEPRPR